MPSGPVKAGLEAIETVGDRFVALFGQLLGREDEDGVAAVVADPKVSVGVEDGLLREGKALRPDGDVRHGGVVHAEIAELRGGKFKERRGDVAASGDGSTVDNPAVAGGVEGDSLGCSED